MTEDPLHQLERSHRRLEERLDNLAAAVRGGDVVALRDVCAFFARQVLRHEQDEEQSLFPRLLGAEPPAAIRALVERLRVEHAEHEALRQRLENATDGVDRGHEGADREILSVSEAIARAYRAHIAEEESQLFPAARAALTPADLEAMAKEMGERRGRRG